MKAGGEGIGAPLAACSIRLCRIELDGRGNARLQGREGASMRIHTEISANEGNWLEAGRITIRVTEQASAETTPVNK